MQHNNIVLIVQFDVTATAVIMTRNSTKVHTLVIFPHISDFFLLCAQAKYEALLSGAQLIESK